jgi:transposase, IS30 family
MKKYKRLTASERVTMHEMRARNESIFLIARVTGRSQGTVSKELRRHRHPNWRTWINMSCYDRARYAGEQSVKKASRRGRKRKFSNPALTELVFNKLYDAHWSPAAIAEWCKTGSGLAISVCTKTIYNALKSTLKELRPYLRQRGKKRRQRVCHRRGRFKEGAPAKRPIAERPPEVAARKIVGHFEVDTVVSPKGTKGGVLALRERSTRMRHYAIIPNLKAATVLPVLRSLLEQWPAEYRLSVTFDNGVEFSTTEMVKLESYFPGLKTYYTDAYASWQKGSVENANGELRWFYPKGTKFSKVPNDQLQNAVGKLNRVPMKCLGWRSSQEAYDTACSALQQIPIAVASIA